MTKTTQLNMFAQQAMLSASKEALNRNNAGIAPEHVLLAMIDKKTTATKCLEKMGVKITDLILEITRLIGAPGDHPSSEVPLNDSDTNNLLETAREEAVESRESSVGTEHLLLGFLKDNKSHLSKILSDRWGVNYNRAKFTLRGSMRQKPKRHLARNS